MEDANKSLEYQYAMSYPNAIDRLLIKVFTDALPAFNAYNDSHLPLIKGIIKEDLLEYVIYTLKFPRLEAEYLLVEKILTEAETVLPELKFWFKFWYNKWLERTQIVSKKQVREMSTKLSNYSTYLRTPNIQAALQYELECVSRETLIDKKEFCCTHIIARDIVLYSLRKEFKEDNVALTVPDQLRLMNVIVRRTREIASTVGKLVFIGV